MIVRGHGDGLALLAQHDHAMLTMPLVDAWAADVPRRGETALAAGQHDNGWVEWDAAPRVGPDGAPYDYTSIPRDQYREVWRRGFARGRKLGDWPGLLVSLHGTRFLARSDDPGHRALLAEERDEEAALLERLGFPGSRAPDGLPPEVRAASDLVAWLDGLSLFLCERWESPWTAEAPGAGRVTVTRLAEDRVALAPWPFRAGALDVSARARLVRSRRFPSDDALREAVAAADEVEFRWRLLSG